MKATVQKPTIPRDWTRAMFSREAAPYWTIAAVALGIRIAHQIIMSSNDPMYGVLLPGGDNYTYHRWASEISQTFWLGWDRIPFLHGPLYPYILSLVYLRFEPTQDAAAWFQRFLGTVTVVLIFYLARTIFGKKASWFAGVGAAAAPLFLLYEGEVLVESVVLFLYMVSICVFINAGKEKTKKHWALCGLVIGLCCLARPNALVFIPFIAGWIAWIVPGGVRTRMASVMVYLALTAIVIAPATILNVTVGNRFFLVTHSGAVNLYIGNAPDAIGLYCTPPSMKAILEKEAKDEMDIDWWSYLLHSWKQQPRALPRNLLKKTVLFWQSGELPSNINFYLKQPFSPFLALPFRWGGVAPLAIIGILIAFVQKPLRRLDDPRLILLGCLFLYSASIVMVFVPGRLRLPAQGILFIFFGHALASVVKAIQQAFAQHSLRPLVLAVIIVTAWGGLGITLKTRDDKDLIRWNDHYNMGTACEIRGKHREALEHYEKAAKRAPDIPALQKIRADMRARVESEPIQGK